MLILAIFRAKIAQKTVFRIFRMVGPIKSTKRVAPRQNIENLGQESARKSLVPPLCGLIGMNQYFSRVSLRLDEISEAEHCVACYEETLNRK